MSALDALFRDEVERQASVLRRGLERCERLPPDGEMLFAGQALKGAGRVVDIPAAEQLADGIEQLLGAAESAGAVMNDEQLSACADAIELIEAIAQSGAARANEVAPRAQVQAVLERLASPVVHSSSPAPPRASVLKSLPAATLELFCRECEMHADTLAEGLLQLEQQPDKPGLLDRLMRASHSMKGAARAVGLDAVVTLAHVCEDQLERARQGQIEVNPELVDAMLAASDLLKRLGSTAASGVGMPADSVVIACAQRITRAGVASVFRAAVDAAPVPVRPAAATEAAADTPAPPANEDDRVLRIRAAQLSRLVALSGELVVGAQQMQTLVAAQHRMRAQQARIADMLDGLQQMTATGPAAQALRAGIQRVRLELNDLRATGRAWTEQLERHARREEELSLRLHRESLDSRMRPVADSLAALPRLVRDLAKRLRKQARLTVSGDTHRIDRDILARLEAPLNHLLRNALDHGLETPARRRELGKPEQGTLTIEVRLFRGLLEITLGDDGSGINIDKVRTRIAAQALAPPEALAVMSEERLLDHLFLSGFSTAPQVTEISGRGVGLAVVRSVMRDIGGSVSIQTQAQVGARFQMLVPISRSVLRAVVVSVAGEPHAFALTHVQRLVRLQAEQVQVAENRPFVMLEGEMVSLVWAWALLELGPAPAPSDTLDVVVVSDLGHSMGFVVEAVLGEQDMVLLALDARLGRVPHLSASAILPDGRPVMVLDAEDMVRSVLQAQALPTNTAPVRSKSASMHSRRVLVVDDSSTVREMERELLSRSGYEVVTAEDGMQAWNTLQQSDFGLVVTDIDMPLLDGIGLLRSIRQDPDLRNLPVIMVSYRAAVEDRQRGLDAGANIYLAKTDYTDAILLAAVAQLIGAN